MRSRNGGNDPTAQLAVAIEYEADIRRRQRIPVDRARPMNRQLRPSLAAATGKIAKLVPGLTIEGSVCRSKRGKRTTTSTRLAITIQNLCK